MTLLPPKETLIWLQENWKILSGVGSLGVTGVCLWATLWLTVRDHGGYLEEIKAKQIEQAYLIEKTRIAAVEQLKDFANQQDRWQDKAEKRDIEQDKALRDILEKLGKIAGQINQQANKFPNGWKYDTNGGG